MADFTRRFTLDNNTRLEMNEAVNVLNEKYKAEYGWSINDDGVVFVDYDDQDNPVLVIDLINNQWVPTDVTGKFEMFDSLTDAVMDAMQAYRDDMMLDDEE